jgi:hypothetical protein
MNRNNQNKSALTSRKPYCKVCHDAGKPESDYTSHYVRSLPDKQGNTKVICPTLLNTECRYCYELGHTSKFCPSLASKQKADERNRREEEVKNRQIKKPVYQPKKIQFGGFSALMDSDDEDETKKSIEKEEFPALGAPSQRVVITSYASVAAKPVPVQTPKATLPSGFKVLQKDDQIDKPIAKKNFNFRTDNWALCDSSDDEDEEEHVDNTAW